MWGGGGQERGGGGRRQVKGGGGGGRWEEVVNRAKGKLWEIRRKLEAILR